MESNRIITPEEIEKLQIQFLNDPIIKHFEIGMSKLIENSVYTIVQKNTGEIYHKFPDEIEKIFNELNKMKFAYITSHYPVKELGIDELFT
jgi:F0F1-type ATP synthase delta subunit